MDYNKHEPFLCILLANVHHLTISGEMLIVDKRPKKMMKIIYLYLYHTYENV